MRHSRHADHEAGSSFSIDRIEAGTWVIRDLTIAARDAQHVVACVTEADGPGVEVVWVRAVPLPTRYASVGAVLEDLQRWKSRRRSEPPMRIPRLAPHPRPRG